jgi:hypothetical protein
MGAEHRWELNRWELNGSDGFARLLLAELINFLTVRAWKIALCAVVLVLVLGSVLSALVSHQNNAGIPIGPDGEAVSDTYMFVHQALAGDGTLTVRVSSLSGEHATPDASGGGAGSAPGGGWDSRPEAGLVPWAKAGIIFEPSTKQGTDYAAVMVTGSHGVRMQYNYTHDSPGIAGAVAPSSPRWLRLTRAGDAITGYDSADGTHWTALGTARLTGLPRVIQIGLFVTSPVYFAAGSSSASPSASTATMDQVSARGNLPGRTWRADQVASFYPSLPSASTWRQRSADAFTIGGSGDIAPLVDGTVFSNWSGAAIVNGTVAGLVLVIVLAALLATAEYRRKGVRTAPAVSLHPGRVLAARAVVAGSLVFAAGAIATAISEVTTRRVLAANGNYLFPQSGLDLARVIIGTGLLLGLAAALVAALGAMFRGLTATIVAGSVFLVLPGVLATSFPGAVDWLMRLTPTAAFAIQATVPRSDLVSNAYTPYNGYFPIGPWAGLGVLAAYTALAMGAASWLLHREHCRAGRNEPYQGPPPGLRVDQAR